MRQIIASSNFVHIGRGSERPTLKLSKVLKTLVAESPSGLRHALKVVSYIRVTSVSNPSPTEKIFPSKKKNRTEL